MEKRDVAGQATNRPWDLAFALSLLLGQTRRLRIPAMMHPIAKNAPLRAMAPPERLTGHNLIIGMYAGNLSDRPLPSLGTVLALLALSR